MKIKEYFKEFVIVTLQLIVLSVSAIGVGLVTIGVYVAVYHLFGLLYSIHISLAIALAVILFLLYMRGLLKLFGG